METATHPVTTLRRARRMSRHALAAEIAISAVALGRYERWERVPPAVVIRRLIEWSGGELSFDGLVPSQAGLRPTRQASAAAELPVEGR